MNGVSNRILTAITPRLELRKVWRAQKAEAFKAVIDLPRRVSMPIEVVVDRRLQLPPLARACLESRLARRLRPRSGFVPQLHSAIAPEFSPARPICSLGKSGLFSDRTDCYLAAGRPVVMVDTDLGRHVPVRLGLLTYVDVRRIGRARLLPFELDRCRPGLRGSSA